MDLFELLFIALFIIFPILEGVLKQRRKGKGSGPTENDAEDSARDAGVGWSEPDPEPRSAADMVPDDLWEVMTGERRPAESGAEPAPWSSAPDGPSTSTEPSQAEPAPEEWRSESWVVDDEAESLEYQGPEAYSLETPAPDPIERRLPSPEARHRAFHELVDRPRRKRKVRVSPLLKELRSSRGLRQAVLLKEILGPPKGLE